MHVLGESLSVLEDFPFPSPSYYLVENIEECCARLWAGRLCIGIHLTTIDDWVIHGQHDREPCYSP